MDNLKDGHWQCDTFSEKRRHYKVLYNKAYSVIGL